MAAGGSRAAGTGSCGPASARAATAAGASVATAAETAATCAAAAARMGGCAAISPVRGKSISSRLPFRWISGSKPLARFTTTRTSLDATSGCSNALMSETGPPVTGAMRTAAAGAMTAFSMLSTIVSGSGSYTR